jgi:hypothetical protein
MRIWTLVFVSVASIVALLSGAASWESLWVAARIVLLIVMALVLLAAIRGFVLRLARPWEDGGLHHLPPARVRRPYRNVGRVAHLARLNFEQPHPVSSSRTARSVGEGRTL